MSKSDNNLEFDIPTWDEIYKLLLNLADQIRKAKFKPVTLVRHHLREQEATKVKTATIYYKPWSVVTPDWYERKTSHWIVFPWERKETVRNVVKRFKGEGKTVEEARDTLVHYGLDARLVERLLREVLEGQA